MDFGTALVVIAGIGAWYSLRSQGRLGGTSMRRRDRQAHESHGDPLIAAPSARENELEREVESLRERIHVLERIATDGRHTRELANEIESLRDR